MRKNSYRSNDGGIIETTASNPYKTRSLRNEERTSSSEFDKKVLKVVICFFIHSTAGHTSNKVHCKTHNAQ